MLFRPDGVNEWLGQGDLFAGISLTGTAGHFDGLEPYAILVLDHECQVAKPKSSHVICTAVFPLETLDSSNQGNVRAGSVRHAMWVPGVAGGADAFADFRYVCRIPKDLLEKGIEDNKRVASMTEDGRVALQEFIFRHFARRMHPGDDEISTPPAS